MKKLILALLLVCASAFAETSEYQYKYEYKYKYQPHVTHTPPEPTFGIGLMFGEPSGITAKYWLDRRMALDFGLAYSWNNHYVAMVDLLFHFPVKNERILHPYIGIGIEGLLYHCAYGFHHWRDDEYHGAFGARLPIGIEIKPSFYGVFLELAPGLILIPGVEAFLQGDVGLRFYL